MLSVQHRCKLLTGSCSQVADYRQRTRATFAGSRPPCVLLETFLHKFAVSHGGVRCGTGPETTRWQQITACG